MGAIMAKSGGGGRRGGRGRRRNGQPMAEINVTPFVDVMLVLLIIFMVAAPLLTVGVPLDLPKSKAQSLPSENEPPLTINLDGDGRIYIQKTEVSEDELVPRLQAIQAERTSDRVYLRADKALDYGRVMRLMGELSAGGFAKVALVTDQSGPKDR